MRPSGRDLDIDEISTHVHLEVSKEKKAQWLKHAFEHYRGNLTALIESAVDNTVSSRWVLEDDTESETRVDLTPLESELGELKEQVSSISSEMYKSSQEDMENLSRMEFLRLAADVQDLLPIVWNPNSLPDIDETSRQSLENDDVPLTTAPDIASHIDVSERLVRQACRHLEQEEPNVDSVVRDGVRCWFQTPDEPDVREQIVETDDTDWSSEVNDD
ncbi:hypothetical protein C457_13419 [Haloferax prahovense DSM 18310]|uniref:Uncharacterized protein n=1 Tax=Haloferax prahovense (strain DSM 18310 / JCM 13924 / TL6) TaxID=1227461 RepID=M0G895_HALPT|nr:hypothetical protein [Haloferax prahovense]ELZ67039.1 hypothetical protein C457_13419 [Haloferax prahovense DSM 18310]